MLKRPLFLSLLVLGLMMVPASFATNVNNNDNGNSGNGHPTPGLDAATLAGLGSMGYLGIQYLKTKKNNCDK